MYREIVTKAVIGKGKIANNSEVILNVSNSISKVLGCWVINHYYVSDFQNGMIFAKGKYDVHVWYGYDNDSDTIIHKQTVDYIEEFSLKVKENEVVDENNECIIKCIKYPTCTGLVLNENGTVSVKIDKELALDVIGETVLKVQTSSSDDWAENDEINNINVNYFNKE